ncbi:MAG: DUF4421 domain-containing protein [Bacteroidales bacterium]|nr:DUF4421 domain-containing protein [Bacteroidales bacterium]
MNNHILPLCLLAATLHGTALSAQELSAEQAPAAVPTGLKAKVKRTFGQVFNQVFSEVDSTYIADNRYNLAFMLEQSFWGEKYRMSAHREGELQRISFAPDVTPKIGVYFGWRWIFLGVAFNTSDLMGKNKNEATKKEFVLNLYSSRFGIDLYYRKTGNDFHISSYKNFDLPTDYVGQDFKGFESTVKGLNIYWIFNNRKFSYPAAYSQSTNQRVSCGSFMAGFSYSNHKIGFDYTLLPADMVANMDESLKFNNLQFNDYNLSFGYGYNWVFAKNCLFNLSLMPALSYKKARINGLPANADTQWRSWVNNLNVDLITRAGLTWNNSKYFVGASLYINTYYYHRKELVMTNSFGGLRIYSGFNFWKKRQYRGEEAGK